MLTRRFTGGRAIVDGGLAAVDLVVSDGVIRALLDPSEKSPPHADLVDCRGHILAPGFIDLQCNGAMGVDLTTEPTALAAVARSLPRFGVTAFLPTVVTSPESCRRQAIEALGDHVPGAGEAIPLGLHFEGPMISHERLGAHAARHVAAISDDEVDRWVASGLVSMVTLAPEVPGAISTIERLTADGIAVACGHTSMSADRFAIARRAGLSYATHLFNAMAPFEHREPGPIGAVLADDDVVAGLICDGVHVDPVAIRMAWNALGPSRFSLVSDASPALGMPYGRLQLGELEIVHDATGVRTADGALAGSALALDQAVRNLIEFARCDIVDALATVTTTPADLLGVTDRGRLAVGARADLAIMDDDAGLLATVIAGDTVWAA